MLAIELRDVEFHYPSAPPEHALHIPHWQVDHGQRLFLHGRSGSGKTTLLRLLTGMMLPQQGQIRILGEDIQTMSASQRDSFRARHIGQISQQFYLLPYLSVADNIRLAAVLAKKSSAALDNNIYQLLEKLDMPANLFHQTAGRLSQGQQQRVAIARALINQPLLLFADEPTSALDEDSAAAFIRLLLQNLTPDTTLIMISHDHRQADWFDQSVALQDLTVVREDI
ncbi:ABC transporter ATP-binding protein [Oceanobacter sp. 4_MG-2023]|uniref:ABC transporter ATP-binding protein n=1 Tax=Oceanobacter sp. 4_MG-2023 TaxID=3062623 RepID=UPI002735E230|nr:ABC transporter ATP-binding protein [Oceanobacter sp. 4_MG-2023]MDP2548781.1 ABC transporter ATP-binding protein [Oceanobacter sp. 4_MG-2023]